MIKLCIIIIILFSIIVFCAIAITHAIVFRRADYKEYDSKHFLLYSDLNSNKYPREVLSIPSGKSKLTGYLYGSEHTQGLVVISPGHRNPNDVKLYDITGFIHAGWMVLCFDYTGCYTSQGKNMVGYTQAVHDLDAVLDYVEGEARFNELPVVLFGHSLGAYASAAVLQYGHDIKAAVIASGFDTPREQWEYSIKRFTGIFHYLLLPYTKLYIVLKYGKEAELSAVVGIDSVKIPVLVISGTKDVFYGGESAIYLKRNNITNKNCIFELETKENHNGHYDYFLSDAALDYQAQISDKDASYIIDKSLYIQNDVVFMNHINSFLLENLKPGIEK